MSGWGVAATNGGLADWEDRQLPVVSSHQTYVNFFTQVVCPSRFGFCQARIRGSRGPLAQVSQLFYRLILRIDSTIDCSHKFRSLFNPKTDRLDPFTEGAIGDDGRGAEGLEVPSAPHRLPHSGLSSDPPIITLGQELIGIPTKSHPPTLTF